MLPWISVANQHLSYYVAFHAAFATCNNRGIRFLFIGQHWVLHSGTVGGIVKGTRPALWLLVPGLYAGEPLRLSLGQPQWSVNLARQRLFWGGAPRVQAKMDPMSLLYDPAWSQPRHFPFHAWHSNEVWWARNRGCYREDSLTMACATESSRARKGWNFFSF